MSDLISQHRAALEAIEQQGTTQLADAVKRATRLTAATVLGETDTLQQLAEESRNALRDIAQEHTDGAVDA